MDNGCALSSRGETRGTALRPAVAARDSLDARSLPARIIRQRRATRGVPARVTAQEHPRPVGSDRVVVAGQAAAEALPERFRHRRSLQDAPAIPRKNQRVPGRILHATRAWRVCMAYRPMSLPNPCQSSASGRSVVFPAQYCAAPCTARVPVVAGGRPSGSSRRTPIRACGPRQPPGCPARVPRPRRRDSGDPAPPVRGRWPHAIPSGAASP